MIRICGSISIGRTSRVPTLFVLVVAVIIYSVASFAPTGTRSNLRTGL